MLRHLFLSALLPLMPLAAHAESFSADVWADNWFDMRVNGQLVAEDSVSITTERSFNAESFEFEAERPFVVGVTAKDFKQDDTGLEYIGSRRQQMGDGGIILQIKDSKGAVVAVSDETWRCMVIHKAPLDKSCAKERDPQPGKGPCGFEASPAPTGWDKAGFDDKAWPRAHPYSARDVRPKDGYDRISWSRDAKLVWGPDLEQSNTILCRFTVE